MALNPESGAVKLYADREEIDSFVNLEIQERLNEVDTFKFDAFITGDQDRVRLTEGNNIHVFEGTTLLFKGRLTEVNFTSAFEAECEGDGMSVKLLNRKTERVEYDDLAADQIVKNEVPDGDYVSYGTIESAPQTSLRFDHDNEARAVAGAANAVGYDWRVRQEAADDYDTDFLDFAKRVGSSSSVFTFDIGDNAEFVDRQKDDGFLANDITFLGRGDGINQLEVNVFAAADSFTDLNGEVTETESTSFNVVDATQLGSTGDNVIVRVGSEVFDCDISDSTTLSINSRGLNDYNGDPTEQINHQDGVTVWLKENVTQSLGPYTPESASSAETGSSIEVNGVRERRATDKTIIDKPTLEKVADRELRNRFKNVFRVEISPSDPRTAADLEIGDAVTVKDVVSSDVDDTFRVVGIDHVRNAGGEGTTLHLANRPRRLTERLSEIESDRDTLNAHMQGATNIDSQAFGDNCDADNPLRSSVYIPADAVAVNKLDVTFKRESFRGYVQNQDHSHSVSVTHPSHSHSIDEADFQHDHNIPDLSIDSNESTTTAGGAPLTSDSGTFITFGETISSSSFTSLGSVTTSDNAGAYFTFLFTQNFFSSSTGNDSFSVRVENTSTGDVFPDSNGQEIHIAEKQVADDKAVAGPVTVHVPENFGGDKYEIQAQLSSIDEDWDYNVQVDVIDEHEHSIAGKTVKGDTSGIAEGGTTPTSTTALGTTQSETTDNAGAPSYGIFEPTSEPDVDVEVRVDGTLVETVNNVSVGDEITTPISLTGNLSEPVAGEWHDITLTPVDTGGGNNGRSGLNANVFSKVFIESKL